MPQAATELTSSQLRDALALVGELAACRRSTEVNRQLKELPGLLGTDTVLIGEVRRSGGAGDATAILSADEGPAGAFDGEAQATFTRLWHQHPVVSRHFTEPGRRAMKISDFLSDRQWRRTELFSDCYGGRLGLGWEISTQIRFDDTNQTCVALGRTNRDFGEHDRAFLDVINPHLRAAYARFEQEATRDDRIALLERGIESRGEVLLLVDPRGKITAAGPTARAILRRWFEDRPDLVALPREVESWRRAHRGDPDRAPLDLRRGDRRLRLRLLRGAEEDAIMVSERHDAPPDPERLRRALPISRREAEVLALIARGHINTSIALELDLSPNTVGRYVERIYTKLDVHNRAEATAAVRDALDW